MRLPRVLVALFALAFLSTSAPAATLFRDDGPGAPPSATAGNASGGSGKVRGIDDADDDAEAAGAESEGQPPEADSDESPGRSGQAPGRNRGVLADLNGNGLSDGLEGQIAGLAAGERIDVFVTFRQPGGAGRSQNAVGPFTVNHEFTLINAMSASMTVGQARALARAPHVFRVEEVFEVSAIEATREDFGINQVPTLANGVDYSATGQCVTVCVADTGATPTHEQFIHNDATLTTKVVKFYNAFTDQELDGDQAFDDHTELVLFGLVLAAGAHGSRVSAVAVGDGDGVDDLDGDGVVEIGDNGNGATERSRIAGYLRGVAPGAGLKVAKVLDDFGSAPDDIVMKGVEWCALQSDVDVINLSLGSNIPADRLDALSQIANAAGAARQDGGGRRRQLRRDAR